MSMYCLTKIVREVSHISPISRWYQGCGDSISRAFVTPVVQEIGPNMEEQEGEGCEANNAHLSHTVCQNTGAMTPTHLRVLTPI